MKLKIREVVLFGMYGALIFASMMVMQVLPNIHLVGVFIVALTVVYRRKALYPIYIFVLLTGLFGGFNFWWVPYLYIWTVLWGITMLLPKRMPKSVAPIVYMAVCSLHGFLYGILYAPAQALFFGLDFKGMLTWIAAGSLFDTIHGVSNLLCGTLIVPIVMLLKKADKAARIN